MRISADELGRSRRGGMSPGFPIGLQTPTPWTIPEPPPGVLPPGAPTMAMDDGLTGLLGWAGGYAGMYGEGIAFMGFPYLAELAQRAEYRRPSEQIAKEMTRKWIKLTSAGDGDKTDKLAAIDVELERLKAAQIFRRAAEHDGLFGSGRVFIDVGTSDSPDELKTPLIIDKAKIKKNAKLTLRNVEPLWVYPAVYNSSDPLADDFYRPQAWYVMGRQVHASRWLSFIGREVPDMLKPAYLFGGLSLSQMGKPYVDNWLRTRQSVSDLISAFSQMILKTVMASTLSGASGTGLDDRAALFNNYRDNSGLFLLDKETEDFANVSAPLGTLDKLQAQAQEQQASVWGIPLVVLLGITPSGLNASTDGEIAVWQAWVEAMQEHLFDDNVTKLIKIVQLVLFGEIDPDISHKWEPLGQMSALDLANVRKLDAETDTAYTGAGILDPIEVRGRIAAEEDSAYPDLVVDDVPEPPMDLTGANDPLQEAA